MRTTCSKPPAIHFWIFASSCSTSVGIEISQAMDVHPFSRAMSILPIPTKRGKESSNIAQALYPAMFTHELVAQSEILHLFVGLASNARHHLTGLLRPPIQTPILNRFGDVRRLNVLGAGEVGDGSADLQNAAVRSRTQAQFVDRHL